jgi:hypothetical protein
MDGTIYYVLLHEEQWTIKLRDKHYGPYRSQQAAIEDAIEAARQLGKTNPGGAQVLVQVEGDRFNIEWTYGQDAYPPPLH